MKQFMNVYRTKLEKLDAVAGRISDHKRFNFCYFVNKNLICSTDIGANTSVKRPSCLEEFYNLNFDDISDRINNDGYILIDIGEILLYSPPVSTSLLSKTTIKEV